MTEDLAARGVSLAAPAQEPDIVIINTCTVTREATKGSRSAIRRAARSHPNAKVVVIGCYAVSDPNEVAAIEGVDVVLTNEDKEHIAEVLGASAPTAPLLQIGRRPVEPPELGLAGRVRVRANLKVQTGCDEWCTFCIIPTTRGALRSFNRDELVAGARAKVRAGAREIVLTGVHLGKYGYDRGGDEHDLIALLQELVSIEGLWRLRLSSILCRHLTDDVLSFIASEQRICRYLHVPLQAGDDEVLSDMHRPYDAAELVERVEKAMSLIDGLALATDIIVGFPGETEEAFVATMEVVERVRFSKLHVFRYSARPGTPAAGRPDALEPDVKRYRSKRLIELGNRIRSDFLAAHLHSPLEVLVEDERMVDGVPVSSGQTGDYVRVWFEGGGYVGKMVIVEGLSVRADGLRGRLT